MNKCTSMTITAAVAVTAGTLLFAAGFATGWYRGELEYTRQIEADRAQVEALAAAARGKEHEAQQQVADALAARDKALRDADDLRTSLDSVQLRADELADRLDNLSRSTERAGDCDCKRLGNCERLLSGCSKLLGRGLKLAERGAGLSAKVAADKEVLVEAIKAVGDFPSANSR